MLCRVFDLGNNVNTSYQLYNLVTSFLVEIVFLFPLLSSPLTSRAENDKCSDLTAGDVEMTSRQVKSPQLIPGIRFKKTQRGLSLGV